VEVTATPQQVQPGEPVSIQLTISDASPIESVTVTINGAPLTLSGNQASYTASANDFYTVVAQATDSAGNTGAGQTVFRAFDGSDDTAPVVDLADAVEFTVLNSPRISINSPVPSTTSILSTTPSSPARKASAVGPPLPKALS
jgi:hypothetical protein